MKSIKLFFFLFAVQLLVTYTLKSQTCVPCTYTINSLDSSSYTLSAGQILCLDTAARFTGTLILNGGSVCNKGLFEPKSIAFNSGTINNQKLAVFSSSFVLGSNTILYNQKQSVTKFTVGLTISGGFHDNKGITTVQGPLVLSSGSILNSGIINCKGFSGNSSNITNSGIINK